MKYYYIHHLSSSAINITKRAVGNTFSPGEPVEYGENQMNLPQSIRDLANTSGHPRPSKKKNKIILSRSSNEIETSHNRNKNKSKKVKTDVNANSIHQVYGLSPEIDTLQSSVVER